MLRDRVRDAVADLAARAGDGEVAQLGAVLAQHLPAGALADVVDAVLDRLACQPLGGGVDDDALNAAVRWLQRCESRVHAQKLRRLDAVAQPETFRADRERSAADWARAQLGLSGHDARAQLRTARAMTRLPATATRLASGDLTPSHAGAVAQGVAVLDDLADHAAAAAGADVEAYLAAVTDAAEAVTQLDGFISEQPAEVDPTELGKRIHAWAISRQPRTPSSAPPAGCAAAGCGGWRTATTTDCTPRS